MIIGNRLTNEVTELHIFTKDEELKFISPETDLEDKDYINGLNIDWNYKDDDDKPATFEITIKGLSQTTASKIKLKDNVLLSAGFDSDIGEIAEGFVIDKVYNKNELKIICSELDIKFNDIVSVSYEPGTLASQIITDLARKINFFVKQLDLEVDVIYENGESITGHGLKEIQEIVKDCESKINIKSNLLYIYSDVSIKGNKYVLDFSSGLLEQPKLNEELREKIEIKPTKKEKETKETTKKSTKKSTKKTTKKSKEAKEEKKDTEEKNKFDYEVVGLLIHYLKKGDIIQVESDTFNGDLKIISLNIDDFKMKLKTKALNKVGG
mgnify:CR=1 FL=1